MFGHIGRVYARPPLFSLVSVLPNFCYSTVITVIFLQFPRKCTFFGAFSNESLQTMYQLLFNETKARVCARVAGFKNTRNMILLFLY